MTYTIWGAIAAIFLRKARSLQAPEAVFGEYPDPPPKDLGVPFAVGVMSPHWPIAKTANPKGDWVSYNDSDGKTHGNWARRFGAPRGGGSRRHAGVDLYADPGDAVVAMEDGRVVNHYHFYQGVYALIVQGDSGLVINYGEVAPNSWKDFGLRRGSRVRRGMPIARVGKMKSGAHMLHLETYAKGTKTNKPWYTNKKRPGALLDPTDYLLRARRELDLRGRLA